MRGSRGRTPSGIGTTKVRTAPGPGVSLPDYGLVTPAPGVSRGRQRSESSTLTKGDNRILYTGNLTPSSFSETFYDTVTPTSQRKQVVVRHTQEPIGLFFQLLAPGRTQSTTVSAHPSPTPTTPTTSPTERSRGLTVSVRNRSLPRPLLCFTQTQPNLPSLSPNLGF